MPRAPHRRRIEGEDVLFQPGPGRDRWIQFAEGWRIEFRHYGGGWHIWRVGDTAPIGSARKLTDAYLRARAYHRATATRPRRAAA